MFYSFCKIYEMGTVVKVFECRAKDLHEAQYKRLLAGSADYDSIMINGIWAL